MITLLFFIVFLVIGFSVAVAIGIVALPAIIYTIALIPLLFVYIFFLCGLIWLFEVNIFLGLGAFIAYTLLYNAIRAKRRGLTVQ